MNYSVNYIFAKAMNFEYMFLIIVGRPDTPFRLLLISNENIFQILPYVFLMNQDIYSFSDY